MQETNQTGHGDRLRLDLATRATWRANRFWSRRPPESGSSASWITTGYIDVEKRLSTRSKTSQMVGAQGLEPRTSCVWRIDTSSKSYISSIPPFLFSFTWGICFARRRISLTPWTGGFWHSS